MSLSRFFQTGLFPILVRHTPLAVSNGIFHLCGSAYYFLNGREKNLIRENVRDLLRLGRKNKLDSMAHRVFHGTIEHYFEKMLLASKPLPFIRRFLAKNAVFEREDLLIEAYRRGKGVIMVTAHWGAVELVPAMLQLRGYPLSIILETATPELRKKLENLAEGLDVELIIESAGAKVLQATLSALARGRILITQCDEVDAWRRRKSKTIRLFQRELYFDHTLDFLAQKSKASVLGIYCSRFRSRRYKVVCEDIASAGGDEGVAARALSMWERYLLQAPEQWYQWKKWQAMVAV